MLKEVAPEHPDLALIYHNLSECYQMEILRSDETPMAEEKLEQCTLLLAAAGKIFMVLSLTPCANTKTNQTKPK
jgi:hypothetical protein